MKKVNKLIAAISAVLMLSSLSTAALAASGSYGSSAAKEDRSYTLEEMLTYAIQDEYAAEAEYKKIIDY